MQPGQVGHAGIMGYTCTGFLSFCAWKLRAQMRGLVRAAAADLRGPPSGVMFDRWRLTAHCFFRGEDLMF